MRIRVLCVDDHPVLLKGVAGLVDVQSDMEVVAEATTGRAAIEQFRAHRPDITLMDLQMPELGGLDAIVAIRGEFPEARIIVLTLAEFEGRGIWYWASAMEAVLCERADVALVGGGNSAGQAAVYLAGHAARVYMLVRGEDLSHGMSRYLVDRISNTPTIEVLYQTELCAVRGDRSSGLLGAGWRNRRDGSVCDRDIRNLFLFIGADPDTRWLEGCGVTMDANGFILTGADAGATGAPMPRALETSVQGVFAVGDVRAGSVKRAGGAIGEGAAVVALIHQHLASRNR